MTKLKLFMLSLALPLLMSCGGSGDENSNADAVVTPPIENPTEDTGNTTTLIKDNPTEDTGNTTTLINDNPTEDTGNTTTLINDNPTEDTGNTTTLIKDNPTEDTGNTTTLLKDNPISQVTSVKVFDNYSIDIDMTEINMQGEFLFLKIVDQHTKPLFLGQIVHHDNIKIPLTIVADSFPLVVELYSELKEDKTISYEVYYD